ncbi:MAG: hypothetical protein HQ527_02545 [Cyanobacteria bacterium]|nr:hypothetical protein [Cyanobacteria bacterium bin.51]
MGSTVARTLGLKIVLVDRIDAAVVALSINLFIVAETRLAAMALLRQSADLPAIWLVMVVLEAILIRAILTRRHRGSGGAS